MAIMQKVETPMGAARYMHSVFREKSHIMQLCIKYTTSPPTVLPEGSWQAAAQVSECYFFREGDCTHAAVSAPPSSFSSQWKKQKKQKTSNDSIASS